MFFGPLLDFSKGYRQSNLRGFRRKRDKRWRERDIYVISLLICPVSVDQLESCFSSAKVVGSNSQKTQLLIVYQINTYATLNLELLYVKVSAKCMNLNVNVHLISTFDHQFDPHFFSG